MSLFKRDDFPFWWGRFFPLRGGLKPLPKRTETKTKRQAHLSHDKLQSERWGQDKLGVKPRHTWDDAAAKWLLETSHKRTHEWDKSMLGWFHPFLVGKDLADINRALLDHVRDKRSKGVCAGTVNRYMALVRA